jgi:pimeloyl-ACP methyl ester carboxylesterase
VNAGDLFCVREHGSGDTIAERDPVVLVHGSLTDHTTWQFTGPTIADDHVVVSYDRRGHSRSGPVDGRGTRRMHEADLIEIIEHLGGDPVHLVGNSYGGSIVLGVAARRPDLLLSVTAHEPPLIGVADGSDAELSALIAEALEVAAQVELAVRSGRVEEGVRRFVEDVALGPGTWDLLPHDLRSAMIANAPSFLEMLDDENWGAAPSVGQDLPLLITNGSASPGWLRAISEEVLRRHPGASRHTFVGAGHVPHLTHPADYASVWKGFVDAVPVRCGMPS